jgi:hypothetical protein
MGRSRLFRRSVFRLICTVNGCVRLCTSYRANSLDQAEMRLGIVSESEENGKVHYPAQSSTLYTYVEHSIVLHFRIAMSNLPRTVPCFGPSSEIHLHPKQLITCDQSPLSLLLLLGSLLARQEF